MLIFSSVDYLTDLLGDWLVDGIYGRIGARGRRIRYVAGQEAEARTIVGRCLRRRASARKCIGVSSRVRDLNDPHQWVPVTEEQRPRSVRREPPGNRP